MLPVKKSYTLVIQTLLSVILNSNLKNQKHNIRVVSDIFFNQRTSILMKKHEDFAKTDGLQLKNI